MIFGRRIIPGMIWLGIEFALGCVLGLIGLGFIAAIAIGSWHAMDHFAGKYLSTPYKPRT